MSLNRKFSLIVIPKHGKFGLPGEKELQVTVLQDYHEVSGKIISYLSSHLEFVQQEGCCEHDNVKYDVIC